jgi:predicted PurR-regulated permease PerM
VTLSTWRVVGVLLIVAAALWALNQARDMVVVGIVASFLALAILPAVDHLVYRFGWNRGLATISVLLGVAVGIVALIGLLIPAFIDVASKLGSELPGWLDDLRKTGINAPILQENDQQMLQSVEVWLKKNGGTHVLSIAGSGLSLVAKVFLTLVFTVVIASSEPGILRAILPRLSPAHQERFLDAWDTAIEQTGGYFYSRLLLMLFTSFAYGIAMVVLGMPVLFAIPLAVFGAFFVEFIPLVGGYIGISIPVVFMLVERGWGQAVALLVWAVVYQQIHDYVLSPRISSRTMSLSAGVALGSALLGGSIAGPIGALFAMPLAGMVTAFLRKYLPAQEIVVKSKSLTDPPVRVRRRGRKGKVAASESK